MLGKTKQKYSKLNIDRDLKSTMTRFRFGTSDIVQSYRYNRHTDNEVICQLCREAQENELHVKKKQNNNNNNNKLHVKLVKGKSDDD